MSVPSVKIRGVELKIASQAARGVKVCPRCGLEKPLDGFAGDASKASGRKSHCKDCDNAKCRAYYSRNGSGRNFEVARLRANGKQRCLRCDQVKDVADFPPMKGTRLTGRASYCRPCANLERQERHAIVRARAIRIYGGHCVICGSRKELEFDHIDWDGAEHRRVEDGKRMIRRIARSGAPIPEYRLRLLCVDCHRARGQALRETLVDGPFDPDRVDARLRELRHHAIYRYA